MTLAPVVQPRRTRRRAAAEGGNGDRGDGGRVTASDIRPQPDDALALGVAAGDERALAEIVRRHAGRLKALARAFTGGAADADDIVQETFWKFWRTADRWQPGGPPLGAYLTRMTMNRAIDADRRRRLRRLFGIDAAMEVADPAPTADASLESAAELTAVRRDLAGLPARQRTAILLAADGERTNAEIGRTMGMSVGAVEQLLVRGRRTLRRRLAERASRGETVEP